MSRLPPIIIQDSSQVPCLIFLFPFQNPKGRPPKDRKKGKDKRKSKDYDPLDAEGPPTPGKIPWMEVQRDP